MKRASLGKSERIHKKKDIELLIRDGKRISADEIAVIIAPAGDSRSLPLKVIFSVPKKLFKRAVDRNMLKRRMRESYRLNKEKFNDLLTAKGLQMNLMFIYQAGEVLPYTKIEDKIVLLLNKLLSSRGEDSEKDV